MLSSRTEGTPMVLFEAMDALVPIVTARVGGAPDVVDSSEPRLTAVFGPGAWLDAHEALYRQVIAGASGGAEPR